jgi:hypothetical protein
LITLVASIFLNVRDFVRVLELATH